MLLTYPGLNGKPIIIAEVKCLMTGTSYWFQMLLDTGADETCFPANFAKHFGHNNDHPDVKKDTCIGIGGESDTYIHSLRIGLLDPVRSKRGKHVIAWESSKNEYAFVEKLDCEFGLLGMDIMKLWKSVTFKPHKQGLLIQIEI